MNQIYIQFIINRIWAMLSKLDKFKEEHKQRREYYSSLKLTEAVVARLMADLIERSAEIIYDADISKPQKIEAKCSVIESRTVENHPSAINSEKYRLIKTINMMSRINHNLLIQYLAVEIEPTAQHSEKVQAEVQKERRPSLDSDKSSVKVDENRDKNPEEIKLRLLAQPQLQSFQQQKWRGQPKNKEDFSRRLTFCRQLVESISMMHENELTYFPHLVQQIVFVKQGHLKLATYKFRPWRDVTEAQVDEIRARNSNKLKKAALGSKSTKYSAPQFVFKSASIRDIRLNDIWKVGLFVFFVLTGQELSKQLQAIQDLSQVKSKDYRLISEEKIVKLKKYLKPVVIEETLKTLDFIPSQRKPLIELLYSFKNIEAQLTLIFNEATFKQAKEKYFQDEQQNTVRFIEELKSNEELLTNDHRKKLTDYFKSAQNRVLKGTKLIFRGSHSKFSSRCFYEAVFEKKHILIILRDRNQKKKVICYSQQAFDLQKCNGIFGGYIKDTKKLSFIYSPQENEFCKLKNHQRAIGVSHIQGPIIGDGDIVISDGAIVNLCRFPSSFEPTGKVKKLFKTQKFELQEYDVYQCQF